MSDRSNIIRKLGTFKKQCVHRIRIKNFKQEIATKVKDIGNQPVNADMIRIEDTDIFDSIIPRQEETHSDSYEEETEEETPYFFTDLFTVNVQTAAEQSEMTNHSILSRGIYLVHHARKR